MILHSSFSLKENSLPQNWSYTAATALPMYVKPIRNHRLASLADSISLKVAKDLAKADIPVILTGNRGVPDSWEKKDALTGPPLTPSPAQVLADAGVKFGLALLGSSTLYNAL